MADDKGFFDKFKEAFEEPPKSAQPDRRPLDKDKAGSMADYFKNGPSKQAGGVMQRRMDSLKKGY